jgi:hypothetical protein
VFLLDKEPSQTALIRAIRSRAQIELPKLTAPVKSKPGRVVWEQQRASGSFNHWIGTGPWRSVKPERPTFLTLSAKRSCAKLILVELSGHEKNSYGSNDSFGLLRRRTGQGRDRIWNSVAIPISCLDSIEPLRSRTSRQLRSPSSRFEAQQQAVRRESAGRGFVRSRSAQLGYKRWVEGMSWHMSTWRCLV